MHVSHITHLIGLPTKKQITVTMSHSSPLDNFSLSTDLSRVEIIQEMKPSSLSPLNIPPVRHLDTFNRVWIFNLFWKELTLDPNDFNNFCPFFQIPLSFAKVLETNVSFTIIYFHPHEWEVTERSVRFNLLLLYQPLLGHQL